MALFEQLTNDMKDALKKGEKARLTVLRITLAQCKDEKIRLRRDLTDDDVLTVLNKAVKTRQESLQLYKQGGRQDLVAKEQNEIEILKNWATIFCTAGGMNSVTEAIKFKVLNIQV